MVLIYIMIYSTDLFSQFYVLQVLQVLRKVYSFAIGNTHPVYAIPEDRPQYKKLNPGV